MRWNNEYTENNRNKELPENERNDLFKIVTEFSATKIKDREDEKKIYYSTPCTCYN